MDIRSWTAKFEARLTAADPSGLAIFSQSVAIRPGEIPRGLLFPVLLVLFQV